MMSVRIGPTQDASGRVASATLSPISPASSGGTVVGVQSPPSAPKAHIPKKKRNRAKKSKQRGSYTPPNADAIALKDRTAGADKGSSATLDGKNQGIVTKLIKAVRDVIGLKDEVQDQWERAAEDAEPALDVAAAVTGIPEIAEFFPAAAQVITGFLDAIASSVPGAQPFVMCAKLLLKYGEAYCKYDNAAGELCRRVVFVLQATANLYRKDWQVDSRAVEWVLTNLNSVIEQCCVFFKANDTRGKVAQFFYAKQTLAKIEAADKRLAHAMEDLKFILLIDSRQQSIKRAEALAHHFKNRCKEQQYRLSEAEVSIQRAIETKGGVDAVQQRPDLLAKIAEGIPGVECVTERDWQQLKISFDDCCADVKRAMTTVLDKLDKQSLSISQIDSQIKELAERGSVFKQIKCHTIRALWVKSGWGARVKVAEFMDVIMEEMRLEVETELGHLTWNGGDKVARVGHIRGDETAPRRSDVQTELSRRFQYFSRVLRFMDADGSGTFSPSEVNDFFIIPEWSLLDYFRLVALYIPKYEYEQFHEAETCITRKQHLPAAVSARKLLLEVQSQSRTDRMALKWTNFLAITPPLLESTTDSFKGRLPSWETHTLPQHTLPTMRHLHHRLVKSLATIFAAVTNREADCQDKTMRWNQHLCPAFWELLTAIHVWAPGQASALFHLMSSANVWYTCKGPLFPHASIQEARQAMSPQQLTCLPSTPIHPVLGTAWFPQDLFPLLQPSNALLGGHVRGTPAYVTRCNVMMQSGEWLLACGYATCDAPNSNSSRASGRGTSNIMVSAATVVEPCQADSSFSWLVHEEHTDSSPPRYAWVYFNLCRDLPPPYAAILGHGEKTHTVWIGRVLIESNLFNYEEPSRTSRSTPLSTLERTHQALGEADELPGSVFALNSGSDLDFLTSRAEIDGSITIISTMGKAEILGAFGQQENYSTRYVTIPRDKLRVKLLVADTGIEQSHLYSESCYAWHPIRMASQFLGWGNRTPIIACGTPNVPGYLAWCLGGGSMFVGMCFPSVSRTTAYFAPNPREPYVFYATTRFSVFMSNSKLGTTSLNEPAPNLFWLPSPDLSGREYLKGILQLVTVSSGQSQDATPIVRQQLNVAVPPLSGLGTGAYFIHSAPPLGSSATGSQDAHAKAVLRTEYLYIAINPNMHCTLARQQNFHTAVTPRPSYPVAPDQAPSTEYYAKCAQDSDDDMFAKRRTRPQQVQCDPLPGPTRASSESIQSFSPCVSSPIGEIESNMQVSQVASSCHSINSSAQVAQVSSQQSASLSRPWQESNEAVQALSYTASASVAETKCSTTPSVQLASVESVCPMAQSSSIPIDDAQDDLGETRLSRIEVVNCGTQTQDISYATPEARAAAWTTEGNGSLISRESRTEIVQSSHGCRCSQATQCDMGLAAPAVQDDGMMFTDIRNQAEIPQMLRCASQDSEQFQENTLPVLVSADASPVLVRMESSPCYERPMHMAESAVRILTPTVTSSSHNLVPTVPSVVDDEVGLE